MLRKTLQNPWFWAFASLLGLIIFKSCNKGSIGFLGCNKGDTLSHKIDTTISSKKDSISYIPVPYKVDSIVYIKGKPYPVYTDNQPIEHPEYNENSDTCKEIIRDYNILSDDYKNLFLSNNQRKYYDTTWNGIRIKDTVQQNNITGRKITSERNDTTIHESITIQKHPIVVYFGLKAFGMKSDFFHQAEINLGIRGKNDMEYTIGAGKIRGQKDIVYSFETKLPIRLFKHKK